MATCGIEFDQFATADIEVQAMQPDQASLLPLLDQRKAPKMGKRSADSGEFKCCLVAVLCNVTLHDFGSLEQAKPSPMKPDGFSLPLLLSR
jgi:hypothetical protein